MKQFHSKLDKLYEGLHLKKTYSEESKRPDFDPINDFLIARVYDHIDKNVLGFDWDYSDKEIISDLMGQFKQIKDMIERTYSELNKEDTEERPMATLTPPGIPQSDIGGEGTFITSGDTLIVSIDDVEDRIDGLEFKNLSTGETQTSMIRIRARLETLLRKMGYNVDAPNKQGEFEVRIYWHDKTGDEIDRFKLVRKSRM